MESVYDLIEITTDLFQITPELLFDSKSIILLTSFILNFSVALFLLFKRSRIDRKSQKNLGYAALFVSLWLFASWVNHFHQSVIIVTFLTRVSHFCALAALYFLSNFTLSIQKKAPLKITIFILFLISALTLFTHYIIEVAIPASLTSPEGVIYGELFGLWSLVVFSYAILTIISLYNAYTQSFGVTKEKIKFLLFTLFLSILIILLFNLVLPNLGVNEFLFVGQLATFIFLIGITWVLRQDSIYSLRYMLSSTFSLMIIASILFILSWGTQKIEQYVFGWDTTDLFDLRIIITGLFIASLVAIYIEKLIPLVRNRISATFGLSVNTGEEIKNWLIEKSNYSEDLNDYVEKLLIDIQNLFHSRSVALLIYDLDEFWSSGGKIKKSDIKRYKTLESMEYLDTDEVGVQVVIPLRSEKKTFGVLALYSKRGSSFYSKEQLKMIQEISNIVSVASNRYVYYREQEKFNELLKDKIREATKELEEKVEELEIARRKERDMMDIMGHELRTPLTIIKMKQSLLRKKATESPKEFGVEDFLKSDESIKTALEREIELLETMLSSTKIDAGRMDMNISKVDLNNVISSTVEAYEHHAQSKGLELEVCKDEGNLFAYADKLRLNEVIDNFVSNAIKYTDKGYVKVCASVVDEEIEIKVEDSGKGIPKEAIGRLGEKFFRVGHYIDESKPSADPDNIVRPGGTGLGLYVAFRLIKMMGGDYKVESKEGVGSKFIFTLPLYTGQKPRSSSKVKRNVFRRVGLED